MTLLEAKAAWESAKPLLIDLYCGLGGWAEGFLAEDWRYMLRCVAIYANLTNVLNQAPIADERTSATYLRPIFTWNENVRSRGSCRILYNDGEESAGQAFNRAFSKDREICPERQLRRFSTNSFQSHVGQIRFDSKGNDLRRLCQAEVIRIGLRHLGAILSESPNRF